MENQLTFSIVVCVYGNHRQFSNFLWTAYCQDHDNYEILIVDNATPGAAIKTVYECSPRNIKHRIRYICISAKDKRCRNIAQGINKAAAESKGKYLVIIADPNVLLSFNILESIENLIDEKSVVLSAGCNDVKISPEGTYDSEYGSINSDAGARANDKLLDEMGWPCDPLHLKLIAGKHRFPAPHLKYDCYVVALSKENFLTVGGYNENCRGWGEYHEKFVENLTKRFQPRLLSAVRVLHQYHKVFKNGTVENS